MAAPSLLALACTLLLVDWTAAVPVDNAVINDPEILCGPTSIGIGVDSRNPWEGHLYAKNHYFDAGCRVSGDGQRQRADIELPFDTCSVTRTRSLNPRGIFVTATVVMNFHPYFLTKVDRAYTVQCFYMEADKTVSTELEVSMITTGFQTQFVPMPVCRYEIRESDADDAPQVAYALIGQAVYHKWICDTETTDTFCMRVHSCFVDDGAGDRLELLDAAGCATDKYLLNNLDYPSDLMAGQEVHVFKYADRPQLFFQCQITIDVKEPNGDCGAQTQPQCEQPLGAGDGQPNSRRRRRSSDDSLVVDVRAGMDALGLNDAAPSAIPPLSVHHPVVAYEDAPACVPVGPLAGLLAVLGLGAVFAVSFAATRWSKAGGE